MKWGAAGSSPTRGNPPAREIGALELNEEVRSCKRAVTRRDSYLPAGVGECPGLLLEHKSNGPGLCAGSLEPLLPGIVNSAFIFNTCTAKWSAGKCPGAPNSRCLPHNHHLTPCSRPSLTPAT